MVFLMRSQFASKRRATFRNCVNPVCRWGNDDLVYTNDPFITKATRGMHFGTFHCEVRSSKGKKDQKSISRFSATVPYWIVFDICHFKHHIKEESIYFINTNIYWSMFFLLLYLGSYDSQQPHSHLFCFLTISEVATPSSDHRFYCS